MSRTLDGRPRLPGAAWAIALLFLAQGSVLALFVTPLWDVPDEVVHFATVADLVEGRGVPRPGRTVVPPALVRSWNPRLADVTVFNWAAIHPPGYHVLAAPFLAAARAAGASLEGQVRATRLFSVLCGAAALLVFYRVLREAGGDRATALAGMAGVAVIPTYAHLAAGVNHDVLCALCGGLAALAWMRFVATRAARFAVAGALALAAAGAVKATALPVAAALLLTAPAFLAGGIAARLAKTAGLAAIAFSTTALWALFRGTVPGADFTPAAGAATAASPPQLAAAIVDQTFKNFFGLVGWMGTRRGEVDWVQVSGPLLAVYLLLAAGVAAAAAARTFRRGEAGVVPRLGAALVLVAGAALGGAAGGPRTAVQLAVEAAPLAAAAMAIPLAARRRPFPDAAVGASQVVILVFSAAYFAHAAENVFASGALRGTHGRYFFVVLGFLLPAFALPAAESIRPGAARRRLLGLAVAALLVNEALFFAWRVLPLYAGTVRGSAP
jgi:hypothetical protein